MRELAGVDVAVEGIEEPAEQVVGFDELAAGLDLRRSQDGKVEIPGIGNGGDMAKLIHAVGGMRQANRAGDVIGDRLAGFLRELCVKLRRYPLQCHDRRIGGEIRAVAGGVPGGTGGQLVALQQHAVGPTQAREVIQRAAADNAATDHHRAGVGMHRAYRCARSAGLSWIARA